MILINCSSESAPKGIVIEGGRAEVCAEICMVLASLVKDGEDPEKLIEGVKEIFLEGMQTAEAKDWIREEGKA